MATETLAGESALDVNFATRRRIQEAYNSEHRIEPKSIKRSNDNPLAEIMGQAESKEKTEAVQERLKRLSRRELEQRIKQTRSEMLTAAKNLAFERAAELRDELKELELTSLLER